jgi:ABC-type enterobactin transport system permease subunit
MRRWASTVLLTILWLLDVGMFAFFVMSLVGDILKRDVPLGSPDHLVVYTGNYTPFEDVMLVLTSASISVAIAAVIGTIWANHIEREHQA